MDEPDFANYLPSQLEIEAACLRIQGGWSESERRSRLVGQECFNRGKVDSSVRELAHSALDERLAEQRERSSSRARA